MHNYKFELFVFCFTVSHLAQNQDCSNITISNLNNVIPLTKSLAVDVKLPALNVTVPESSVARFFKLSV